MLAMLQNLPACDIVPSANAIVRARRGSSAADRWQNRDGCERRLLLRRRTVEIAQLIAHLGPPPAAPDLQESSFPQGAAPDGGLNQGLDLVEQTQHVRRIGLRFRLLHQRANLRKCFTRAHRGCCRKDQEDDGCATKPPTASRCHHSS